MFVVRRMTMEDVHKGEYPKTGFVLHAERLEHLSPRVQRYFPNWVWRNDQTIFGGRWVDTKIGETFPDREGETYIIDHARKDEERMINAAYEWHGGGGSALYSWASTGCIFQEEHRSRILDEIARCQAFEDDARLAKLAEHVQGCQVLAQPPFPPTDHEGNVLVI